MWASAALEVIHAVGGSLEEGDVCTEVVGFISAVCCLQS